MRQLVLAAVLLLLLVTAMAVWVGSRRPPVAPVGFAGTWTATNCATHSLGNDELNIDCARWGDRTVITLVIGPGEPASIDMSIETGETCSGSGTLRTRPPSLGDGTFLFVEFPGLSCGLIDLGDDGASHLYLEPNDRRIWFDDDGDDWGLFWLRSDPGG